MNIGVLKLFQGHVVAYGHVLTSHSLLKPLPSQVFILRRFMGILWEGWDEVGAVVLDEGGKMVLAGLPVGTNESMSTIWMDS